MKRTTRELEVDILQAFKTIHYKTHVQKYVRTNSVVMTRTIKYLLRCGLIKVNEIYGKTSIQLTYFITRKGRRALRLWKEFNDLFEEAPQK